MVEMGYCIEVEKSAMLGYDSRYAVAELFCNRSLTDVLYCDYILKLKWNMDPSHPTKNVSPGDGSDWRKEIHCFCGCENGTTIFLWFYHFYFFYFKYVSWWSLKAPSNC